MSILIDFGPEKKFDFFSKTICFSIFFRNFPISRDFYLICPKARVNSLSNFLYWPQRLASQKKTIKIRNVRLGMLSMSD